MHVDATVKKAAKRLYFLMQLKRAHVPAKDLVSFYIACIQSVLLYACQVFHYSLPEYFSSTLRVSQGFCGTREQRENIVGNKGT